MARIEISVQNRVAWQTNSTDYICGNSDFVVGFIFDDEWNEFETKTARFIHGGEHTDIVFTGNECKVPKILNVKRMEVGVFAGDLYTTTPAFVQCRKSILCNSGVPADPTPDVYAQIMKLLETGSKATIGVAELLADKWVGGDNLHSQIVNIDGVTEKSQVDLTPSVEQLVIFYEKDLTFVTENDGGIVTVYAIGQKPTNDYEIQVTITEVDV